MTRYLTFFVTLMVFSSSAQAQMITQEKLKSIRGDCIAVDSRGTYISVDHENATKRCLSACPKDLKIFNNRYASGCIGAYNTFKGVGALKYHAPIARVTAILDYQGHHSWAVNSAENAEVSKHCKTVGLSAAKSYPAPIKGHHMMVWDNGEEPTISTATTTVLVNVRIPLDDKAQTKSCSAEVINLRCQPHEADRAPCNP